MNDVAIKVEGLGKHYRLGAESGYSTLREVIMSLVHRRRPDAARVRDAAAGRADLWALRDVDFEVRRGDVIGIIGRNGAGKSTLLKILSRITAPSEGSVEITGRVGSLLEVGTGFHPELTGRENIFLNGSILGMSRAEITSRFDEIVAFAEVGRFLDTPVKRYSSGMYTRLAFAVAAHLEPEVLVVDEVLAVGDAAFQSKCLGKMRDVGRSGRTVLFVSHNMGAVMQLCQRGILLEQGRVKMQGTAVEAARHYLGDASGAVTIAAGSFSGSLAGTVRFTGLTIANGDLENTRVVAPAQPLCVRVQGCCTAAVSAFRTTLSIYREGVRLLTMHDVQTPATLPAGKFSAYYVIPPFFLRPGEYSVAVGGYRDGMNEWIYGTDLAIVTVSEEWGPQFDPINIGMVNLTHYGTRTLLGDGDGDDGNGDDGNAMRPSTRAGAAMATGVGSGTGGQGT